LADALAKRLNAVLPTPFRAVAHGGELDFLEGESYWMTKSCGVVEEDLDEDEVSYLALADNAVTSALSAVQDVVARATHNPWPMDATGGMAMPSTRIEGTALHLSYGDALVLEPLDLADFLN
jgi:glutamate synthase domain-containing protein 1